MLSSFLPFITAKPTLNMIIDFNEEHTNKKNKEESTNRYYDEYDCQ